MPEALPDELPEGYYLENFEYLLNFVVDRYDHLLKEEEKAYRRLFFSLNDEAKKLYVRLSNRKGPYFRTDKLNYPEAGELPATVDLLSASGLVETVLPDWSESVALCTRDELQRIDVVSDLPKSTSRRALLEVIGDQNVNPVAELNIPVIELGGLDHLMVYRLLFFGNFHQDMTEFVLHKLVSPFESYDLSPDASAFQSRAIVDSVIELKYLSELSLEAIENDDTGDQLLQLASRIPERPDEPMLARRYDRMINRLARQLERLDVPERALDLYALARSTPARERRSRILGKLGQPEASLELCEAIHAAPLNEEEKEFAVFFGRRLSRKHSLVTDLPEHGKVKPNQQCICIAKTAAQVEMCAAEYYNGLGRTCFYVENTLFRGIFGLAFWDIIFAPVPGAFFHPFQRGPADLHTPDFVRSRSTLIDARLAELAQPVRLREQVMQTWQQKNGIANQFVNWTWLTVELLELALSQIPAAHHLQVFRRLLGDLKNNTSGLPDLILFDDTGYELVEIKGPGDKIQKNQERWFRYFSDQGMPASLVNVEWTDP